MGVQKKLDFYVVAVVAEHLALLDGLIEAQEWCSANRLVF